MRERHAQEGKRDEHAGDAPGELRDRVPDGIRRGDHAEPVEGERQRRIEMGAGAAPPG